MNSLMSEDLTRENLILETAKCLREIFTNSQKADALHKEILEIDLSITAYVEESRKNLEGLRLDLANNATSSQEVVEILSDKIISMSSFATTKRHSRMTKIIQEENNKTHFSGLQQARSFIAWFKHMIDNDRNSFGLYLADDALLEWFGRTIKNKKKVAAFLKYDMQCSRHDFTTVECIDKVELRSDRIERNDLALASPLPSPEIVRSEGAAKRKLFLSCNSPEWAEGCKPADELENKRKINEKDPNPQNVITENHCKGRKRLFSGSEMTSKGDGIGHRGKRICSQDSTITPSNEEVGQGDCCLPSTSGTDSEKSHDALNAQLPKLAVECNAYIEFTRSGKNHSTDSMKWERKCKLQISYSEDPLNIGEYIIWLLRYTDETKCRRNLLAAFEEVAQEISKDNM